MLKQRSDDEEAIRNAVREINDHWRAGEYDRIAPRVAGAPPGFDRRVRGRDAYVQSYRDYDQGVRTLDFAARANS